jgi:hypothetical protein
LLRTVISYSRSCTTILNQVPDILFPLLPRWFTAPLRVRTRRAASIHYPESSQRVVEPSPLASNSAPPHDHALLESLYQSIFESRFINLQPTGKGSRNEYILKAHINKYLPLSCIARLLYDIFSTSHSEPCNQFPDAPSSADTAIAPSDYPIGGAGSETLSPIRDACNVCINGVSLADRVNFSVRYPTCFEHRQYQCLTVVFN